MLSDVFMSFVNLYDSTLTTSRCGQDFLKFHQATLMLIKNKAGKNSPEVGEPFDELCCVVFIEFYIWKVHLENS